MTAAAFTIATFALVALRGAAEIWLRRAR